MYLDGALRRESQLDIEAEARRPANRFYALLYSRLRDDSRWVEEKHRKLIDELLEWPEVYERRQLEQSTRDAQSALATLGIDLPIGAEPGG